MTELNMTILYTEPKIFTVVPDNIRKEFANPWTETKTLQPIYQCNLSFTKYNTQNCMHALVAYS